MKALSAFALALLFARSALAATGSLAARYPPDDDDDDDDNSGSSTSTTTTAQSSTAVVGDSRCVSNMCIEAVVNGSTVQYTLTAQRSSVGWIAMGFGTSMARTPMVIMWPNTDGSITLSQRQASGEVEPQVVSSPPRVATLQQSLSVTTGSTPKFVYTIPANSDTRQNIIYAFGTTNPGSSAPNARLLQHTSYGTTTLDLTKTTGGASTTPTPGAGSSGSELTSNQRTLFAHAIIATLGFLLFLPIGALLPRYLRTFVAGPTWFKSHWIIQFLFGGITIIVGVALGIAGVSNRGAAHVNTTHKRLGIVLFALYFLQVGIGAFIHWVKPRQPRARPPQNYFHTILGLVIIALAFAQVRTGYTNEWPRVTGGDDVPNGVNIVWYIWVVALPLAYGAGMAFLPKQYAQERKLRESDNYRLPLMDSKPGRFASS